MVLEMNNLRSSAAAASPFLTSTGIEEVERSGTREGRRLEGKMGKENDHVGCTNSSDGLR